MSSPSIDIKDILESSEAGLTLVYGTDLFISFEPEAPDFCVTIYDTGGFPPQSGYTYDYPTIMIRCRGEIYGFIAAYAIMEDIKDVLHDRHNETWNSTRYVGIWAMGDVGLLGYDENNRPLLSLNFRMHRTN